MGYLETNFKRCLNILGTDRTNREQPTYCDSKHERAQKGRRQQRSCQRLSVPGPCKWSNSSSNTDDDDDGNDVDVDVDVGVGVDEAASKLWPWGKRRSRLWETLPTSLFSASAFRHSLHDLASAGSYTIKLYLAHNHRTWSNHHKRDIGTFDLWHAKKLQF